MKKTITFITGFVIITILTCIGAIVKEPFWACLGSIASAALGSLISIVFTFIDTHRQDWRLWLQQLKFSKKDIRLSFSYLFRIQVDGKYLLVKGNRLKN